MRLTALQAGHRPHVPLNQIRIYSSSTYISKALWPEALRILFLKLEMTCGPFFLLEWIPSSTCISGVLLDNFQVPHSFKMYLPPLFPNNQCIWRPPCFPKWTYLREYFFFIGKRKRRLLFMINYYSLRGTLMSLSSNPINQLISRSTIIHEFYIPNCFSNNSNILDNVGYLTWSLNITLDGLDRYLRITLDNDIG